MVLVDSSVWIDLLREAETPQTHILRQLLPRRGAALTAVVYQEILQGAATPERFTKLKRYFRTLPFLNPAHPIETWEGPLSFICAAASEATLRAARMIVWWRVLHWNTRRLFCTMIVILN